MSGHMGNESATTQNLEVVRVDAERNLILVKGAVPGHKQARVVIKPSVKRPEAQAWVPPVVEPDQPDAGNDAEEAQAS